MSMRTALTLGLTNTGADAVAFPCGIGVAAATTNVNPSGALAGIEAAIAAPWAHANATAAAALSRPA
jgi:hypothetical protein